MNFGFEIDVALDIIHFKNVDCKLQLKNEMERIATEISVLVFNLGNPNLMG